MKASLRHVVIPKLTKLGIAALQWLLPNMACLLCHQHSRALLCRVCHDDLPRWDIQGQDLMKEPKVREGLKKARFDYLHACYWYDSPYDWLIKSYKYNRNRPAGAALNGLLLSEVSHSSIPTPELLISVPLHSWRYLRRQFNQSVALANSLSHLMAIPTWHGIAKHRTTAKLSTLNAAQRRRVLKGAFVLVEPLPEVNHVAIIDDVVTTGSTVNAICDVLRAERPHLKISLWSVCVSRAPGSSEQRK